MGNAAAPTGPRIEYVYADPGWIRAMHTLRQVAEIKTVEWAATQTAERALPDNPLPRIPPDLDPSKCPGCKAPVDDELRTKPLVPCTACGQWELHTGLERMPQTGPPGTAPKVVHLFSPFWQIRQVVPRQLTSPAPPAETENVIPQEADVLPTKKTPVPRDEANISVRLHSKKNPNATVREMAKAIGIAQGRFSQLPAWIAHLVRKKKTEEERQSSPKTVRLTKAILDNIGAKSEVGAGIELEEAAWRHLLENANDDERAKLHALKPAEKAKHINLVIESFGQTAEECRADDW
jgi:hypothetical protein